MPTRRWKSGSPVTIISDLLSPGKFVFFIPTTLGCEYLQTLIPKEEIILPGYTMKRSFNCCPFSLGSSCHY